MISKGCVRVIENLSKHQRQYLSTHHGVKFTQCQQTITEATSLETTTDIIIPKKIERTTVDILQALSSTVGRDPTSFHYMLYDDQYLTPQTYRGEKMFGMAKNSGIKTAHWVMQQHPDLFMHHPDDPIIEKFLPKTMYDNDSEVSDKILQDLINMHRVNDAMTVYDLCEKKYFDVSDETKQSLLELVCFHNCKDDPNHDYPIAKWFRDGLTGEEEHVVPWRPRNFAEDLFRSMESPTAEAYCSMICGMVKFKAVDQAWGLYEETKIKDIQLDTRTYNSLIKICLSSKVSLENHAQDDECVYSLLREMNERSVSPNVQTLNSALESFSPVPFRNRDDFCGKIIAEFLRIGIKPNLTTYNWILINYCKKRGESKQVFLDVLNRLPMDDLNIEESTDCELFALLMASAERYSDWESAKIIDQLLHTGKNFKFMNTQDAETLYHVFFLRLAATKLNPVEFMEMYRSFVPGVVSPNGIMYKHILMCLADRDGLEYIPEVLVVNKSSTNARTLQGVFYAVAKFQPDKYEPDVKENFSTIIDKLWGFCMNHFQLSTRSIEPEFIERFVQASLKCCEFKTTARMIKNLLEEPGISLGSLDPITLTAVVECSVENRRHDTALNALQLWSSYAYEDIEKVCKIAEKMENLTPIERASFQILYKKGNSSE